jgi:hypothetical protein
MMEPRTHSDQIDAVVTKALGKVLCFGEIMSQYPEQFRAFKKAVNTVFHDELKRELRELVGKKRPGQ